ncbi:MAG: hypothetical protein KKC53_01700 [Actinobacteria bacterium]|nr:hypothetical protein [Actinomycetota bacterium]
MLQVIWHYNVKEGKYNDFKNWILEIQDKWSQIQSPGWKYLGTYCTVLNMGILDWQDRYEIENMAAFDTLREYENEEYTKIMKEFYSFVDYNYYTKIEVIRDVATIKILEGT